MNGFDKGKRWLETSGDMTSAGINPNEKAGRMDERQKKIGRQKKTAPLRQPIPKVHQQTTPFGQISPSDAVPDTSGIPDNEPIYDWTGTPCPETAAYGICLRKSAGRKLRRRQ